MAAAAGAAAPDRALGVPETLRQVSQARRTARLAREVNRLAADACGQRQVAHVSLASLLLPPREFVVR